MSRICPIIFLHLALCTANSFAQTADPFFSVEGEVSRPPTLTARSLAGLAHAEVKARDRTGNEHVFSGVRLVDILDSAGVTLGKELRGENLVKYVLVTAADGYGVIFSLPELDPEFNDRTILLAYQVDGNALPQGEGPFRIIVPGEKKHARWISEVTAIRILLSKE